jgi:hypothetical protein
VCQNEGHTLLIFTKRKEKIMSNQQLYKIIETIVLALLTCCAVALGMTSCKAWRTITTTATYTNTSPQTLSQGDGREVSGDGKEVITITTKTVEEYQGVKK